MGVCSWVLAAGLWASSGLVLAQSSGLATRTGVSLGLSLSSYKYDEPGYMSLKGNKLGVDYAATYALGASWPRSNESSFVRGELRYAGGQVDYSSPANGSMMHKPDAYLEARALLGRDIDLGSYILAPYIGLGLRQLRNDLRGQASLGGSGYRRVNRSSYVPLGLTSKTALAEGGQLHTTFEYMHLLRGTQDAHLSDASALASDLRLRQSSGRGLRLQVMRHFGAWAVGPSLSYWQIDPSDPVGSPPAFEPKNKSYELIVKASYQF